MYDRCMHDTAELSVVLSFPLATHPFCAGHWLIQQHLPQFSWIAELQIAERSLLAVSTHSESSRVHFLGGITLQDAIAKTKQVKRSFVVTDHLRAEFPDQGLELHTWFTHLIDQASNLYVPEFCASHPYGGRNAYVFRIL